jgi:hypothetical protein
MSLKLLTPTALLQALFSSILHFVPWRSKAPQTNTDPSAQRYCQLRSPAVSQITNVVLVWGAGGRSCRCYCPKFSSALFLGYRSRIGKNHFLTKELQRYIEGLKKRRSKRLQCRFQ